jgi:hypothetical protein
VVVAPAVVGDAGAGETADAGGMGARHADAAVHVLTQ